MLFPLIAWCHFSSFLREGPHLAKWKVSARSASARPCCCLWGILGMLLILSLLFLKWDSPKNRGGFSVPIFRESHFLELVLGEECVFCWLKYSVCTCLKGKEPELPSFGTWISHASGGDPSPWVVTCSLSPHSYRKLKSRVQTWNPGTLMWDAGHPKQHLSYCSKSLPVSCIPEGFLLTSGS